jgi:hypothetical protein
VGEIGFIVRGELIDSKETVPQPGSKRNGSFLTSSKAVIDQIQRADIDKLFKDVKR